MPSIARREAERHYRVLDSQRSRAYIVGNEYSIADMSAWGWLIVRSGCLPRPTP